ncbi:putative phage tail assembly chaperone [Pseudoalteromonas obscura]|uniref:Phage tail assembly chaperone n=1 Tax=Pseudoalteromonas obscura TaxID=3048491 RepID=A0ABT7ESA6_9GAMM|nr:putative phage tail assembly chaperone [Pseudoalteromonas sp. P94(2023)]MDK2597899.1 putative phage tail assembly chaperone [Pseudoalteromonas sp. P94(2023)]
MKDSDNNIVVTVAGTDFAFAPTLSDHNDYLNSVMPNDKVGPARTMLLRTIDKAQKEALVAVLDTVPGAVVQIHAALSSAYAPTIEISVKK